MDAAFGLVANITGNVSTCDAMNFTVHGGKAPYSITLAAPNSTVLTNVSFGPTDNYMVYINRADPNNYLMGKWMCSSYTSHRLSQATQLPY